MFSDRQPGAGRDLSKTLITSCPKPGWYESDDNRIFLTPLGEVFGDVTDANMFDLDKDGAAPDCEPGGSYEAWQEAAVRCVSMDTPHWGLAPCIGVAGTVVNLLGEPSFGINLCGSSSAGKTSAQKIAAGMWANPAVDKGHAKYLFLALSP